MNVMDEYINLRQLTEKELDNRYKMLMKLQKEDPTFERGFLVEQINQEFQRRYLVTQFRKEYGLPPPIFPPADTENGVPE